MNTRTVLTTVPENATAHTVQEWTGTQQYPCLASPDHVIPISRDRLRVPSYHTVYMDKETIEASIAERLTEDDSVEDHFEELEHGGFILVTYEYQDADWRPTLPTRIETVAWMDNSGKRWYEYKGAWMIRG